MSPIQPYANEADSIILGDLTIENRLDRIELYGSLQLTRDKEGLALARELKSLLDATLAVLESEPLPDRIPLDPTDEVDNPFK